MRVAPDLFREQLTDELGRETDTSGLVEAHRLPAVSDDDDPWAAALIISKENV